MDQQKMEEAVRRVEEFRMPRYDSLPRISLYLEQVIDQVVMILEPVFGDNRDSWITRTMVGNYVKQGLLPRPQGKRYGREHVAYLVYISIVKQVLSMEEILRLLEIQRAAYPVQLAYDYLCSEFENSLRTVFQQQPLCPPSYKTSDVEANVFRSTVIAVCYTIYTRQMLAISGQ